MNVWKKRNILEDNNCVILLKESILLDFEGLPKMVDGIIGREIVNEGLCYKDVVCENA